MNKHNYPCFLNSEILNIAFLTPLLLIKPNSLVSLTLSFSRGFFRYSDTRKKHRYLRKANISAEKARRTQYLISHLFVPIKPAHQSTVTQNGCVLYVTSFVLKIHEMFIFNMQKYGSNQTVCSRLLRIMVKKWVNKKKIKKITDIYV